MLTYMKQLFPRAQKAQVHPFTDERVRRNEDIKGGNNSPWLQFGAKLTQFKGALLEVGDYLLCVPLSYIDMTIEHILWCTFWQKKINIYGISQFLLNILRWGLTQTSYIFGSWWSKELYFLCYSLMAMSTFAKFLSNVCDYWQCPKIHL